VFGMLFPNLGKHDDRITAAGLDGRLVRDQRDGRHDRQDA
jgi:hypothetical protein